MFIPACNQEYQRLVPQRAPVIAQNVATSQQPGESINTAVHRIADAGDLRIATSNVG
jgi:hypothetical protein